MLSNAIRLTDAKAAGSDSATVFASQTVTNNYLILPSNFASVAMKSS